MEELNRIKPAFFFKEVSKKTGVGIDVIEDIYTKYLSRVTEVAKTELKVFITGLGTFERHPNNIFTKMYEINAHINNNLESYKQGIISTSKFNYISKMESYISDLEKLKFKYKYVEKSLEKFWTNCGGLSEFFDSKGRIQKDFQIQDGNMQDMSVPIEECESLEGIFF